MAAKKKTQRNRHSARSTAFLWIVVFGLWIAWSGHFSFEHPFLLGMGAVSASLVTLLCRKMGLVDSEMMPLHLTPRTLRYIPWLAWEVIMSCKEVLQVGLSLRRRVQPRVATLLAEQESSLGFVTYANSITLTPGTLTIDSDAAERTLKVHAFSDATLESLQTGEMNRRVRWVEGA